MTPERSVSRVARRSYYSAKTAVVDRLRVGARSVVWTPETGLGAGNQLYLWLNAFIRQRSGANCRVLSGLGADAWVERFPNLGDLVVDRHTVGFRDRREEMDYPWLRQRVGVDFAVADLKDFVDRMLLPDLGPPHGRSVLNVRRGDFYGLYLEKYGFDIEGYLDLALPASLDDVVVVSDDPDWCRSHLARVLSRARHVTFAPPGPMSQFELLAGAKDLYVTNSTFGYWGGYVSTRRGGTVTAPWLHARGINDDAAYQLLPTWQVIGPGSWDAIPPG